MWQAVAGLVGGAITKWQDRKANLAAANAAWETAAGKRMSNGWADEYVTILITLPLWQIFIGNLLFAYGGDERVMLANDKSLADIGALMDTPYGEVMMVVVVAAVGLKTIKGVLR